MTFLLKIEWVSKNTVFFFPCRKKKYRLLKRVSEWVLTFSGKKKIKKIQNSGPGGFANKPWIFHLHCVCQSKNICIIYEIGSLPDQKNWYQEKYSILNEIDLNINIFFQKSGVSARELFLGKKFSCIFFFPRLVKKKYNFFQIWVSEWPSTFPGKKIRYLWLGVLHFFCNPFWKLSILTRITKSIFGFYSISFLKYEKKKKPFFTVFFPFDILYKMFLVIFFLD